MASTSLQLSSVKIFTLSFTLFFLSISDTVNSIPSREFDSMLSILRARGYSLFSNAISTSDLQFDLLSSPPNSSYTFFAPTDPSLFALDMTQSALSYTSTLCYHVVPRRLSISDLRRLPNGATLPTLLSSRGLRVTRLGLGPRSQSYAVAVDGVDVVLPGLYYGRHVAVHGLGGIFSLRSMVGAPYGPPPVPLVPSNSPRHSPPKSGLHSSKNPIVTNPIVLPPGLAPVEVVHGYTPAGSPGNKGDSLSENSSGRPIQARGLSPETSPVLAPWIQPPEGEKPPTPAPAISQTIAEREAESESDKSRVRASLLEMCDDDLHEESNGEVEDDTDDQTSAPKSQLMDATDSLIEDASRMPSIWADSLLTL